MTSAISLAVGVLLISFAATALAQPTTAPATQPSDPATAIRISTAFEGGSIGRVEVLGPGELRLHVAGQHDERGRNRQASWYYFRLDRVRGRDLKLTLTDFVGEYNDKPGAVPMGPDIVPVISTDGRAWQHVPDDAATWDDAAKELTLTLRHARDFPEADTVWIAHVPPYTPRDLAALLEEVGRSRHAVIEVIGKTVRGRDIHMVTVTDRATPLEDKRGVFLQARQHAWEAGTSWVMEGALRFITSDDPSAVELRKTTVFRFIPMVDVDGCIAGGVRFNVHGYDVNRHWPVVTLQDPEHLRLMPEIWYTKKAILAAAAQRPGIDLMVNMHNTETGEYLETQAREEKQVQRLNRLYDLLVERTSFEPSRKFGVSVVPSMTSTSLATQHGVPIALMEQRIATSKKLGRRPTTEDRLKFGRDLLAAMAEAAR